MSTAAVARPKVVSEIEWLAARKELLAKEKEFSRQRDAMAALRREMPWVKVEKSYVFEGPNGKVSLADLFAGRSQLIIYHFMLGPDWKEGCPGCSFLADTFDGAVPHLAARDTTFVAVSRAPLAQIQQFQKRMGWKFPWFSSNASDFNFDYHVSFAPEDLAKGSVYYNYGMTKFGSEEGPGASVFYKNAAGEIFHTYSTYARGLDTMIAAYNWLDITPKGRDEGGLKFSMAWVRHHDKYTDNYSVDSQADYKQPEKSASPGCCHDSNK